MRAIDLRKSDRPIVLAISIDHPFSLILVGALWQTWLIVNLQLYPSPGFMTNGLSG